MENNTHDIESQDIQKPRKAIVALLYSILASGLGQIYNGQIKKGIIFFIINMLIPFLWGLLGLYLFFGGLITIFILMFLFRIYVIIDSIVYATKLKTYTMKKYNHWQIFVPIAAFIVGITLIYSPQDALNIKVMQITTTSSSPTMLPGDHIVIDMDAYTKKDIQYGDLIAFYTNYTNKKEIFAFRVIGLGGDSIHFQDDSLFINNTYIEAKHLQDLTVNNRPASEYCEILPNGYKHNIYRFNLPQHDNTSLTIFKVPQNCYFVMGDNRDNAFDSRFRGFVKKENVIGQIIYCYYRKGLGVINIDFRS